MTSSSKKDRITFHNYVAPCGSIMLGSFGERLCLCDWLTEKHHVKVLNRLRRALDVEFVEGISPVIENAVSQLNEYFAGKRHEFSIPLLFVGTDFQKDVWNALRNIPYGSTVSYGFLASQIGRPSSVRAVANANGANSISIFAPCHRVIGSDNSLTGYGGGLPAKQFLLKLEKAI